MIDSVLFYLESKVNCLKNKLSTVEAERDALRLRVVDLEQAFNYIKSELGEVHTVNCYPPINNYDPVIINTLKVCEVVLKNKIEASENE
jgi:hypothetical protein